MVQYRIVVVTTGENEEGINSLAPSKVAGDENTWCASTTLYAPKRRYFQVGTNQRANMQL